MADKKTKVLIVEDEETLSQMYSIKFEKEGYDVVTAGDGEVGFISAKQDKPDIILLDIILPKMDGFMVLEQLKNEESTKDMPVIMLTNLGQTEDVEKGKKGGAVGYLVKANCTPMQVVEKVQEVLKKAKK
ncbi:MAG: response regulator transcription factor [Patescibacteria group bacterium]